MQDDYEKYFTEGAFYGQVGIMVFLSTIVIHLNGIKRFIKFLLK